MLDQFRQDMSGDSNDALNDNRFQMSRKKLVFSLSGAALALVLFLFMIGAFRSDTDSTALATNDPESLPGRVQDLQARVEKLEQSINGRNTPLVALDTSNLQERADLAPTRLQELAAPLSDQALKQLINESQPTDPLAFANDDAMRIDAVQPTEVKPAPTPAPAPKATGAQTYTVQKGDTLSKISKKFYGTPNRWKEIADANSGRISNINQLKVGTQLTIPESNK
jgi:LysM repeat protein